MSPTFFSQRAVLTSPPFLMTTPASLFPWMARTLIGTSSMPGTQTMANCPGLAWWRLVSLNQKERIEGVSSIIRSSLTVRGVWTGCWVCSKGVVLGHRWITNGFETGSVESCSENSGENLSPPGGGKACLFLDGGRIFSSLSDVLALTGLVPGLGFLRFASFGV